MAFWQFSLSALESDGLDENGWPITRIVHWSFEAQEKSVLRLTNLAQEAGLDHYGHEHFVLTNVVRVDKQGTSPPSVNKGTENDLFLPLSPNQRILLDGYKTHIWNRVKGQNESVDLLSFLGRHDRIVPLSEDVCCIRSEEGIFSHQAAANAIREIQKFYERVSPDQLRVLQMDEHALSHDDLEFLRFYVASEANGESLPQEHPLFGFPSVVNRAFKAWHHAQTTGDWSDLNVLLPPEIRTEDQGSTRLTDGAAPAECWIVRAYYGTFNDVPNVILLECLYRTYVVCDGATDGLLGYDSYPLIVLRLKGNQIDLFDLVWFSAADGVDW